MQQKIKCDKIFNAIDIWIANYLLEKNVKKVGKHTKCLLFGQSLHNKWAGYCNHGLHHHNYYDNGIVNGLIEQKKLSIIFYSSGNKSINH